ncbi:hypothetical protein EVJ58_g126 [Rhodofomes roseus]|uniref:Sec1-like protein n=1 Tax=Rhodofomes roseus TaxID=34475 RepID=A0A4Y9Z712_9APHY|nr:hypothetical protein EVJ58_g126 [Rhodofomes roseus]
MDIVKAVETYITKLISVPPTMKVLLLDGHTTPIVSLAVTHSTLLAHQVYLTDKIDNKKRDRMPHMKCVCFLQTSEDSLEALEAELREPKYGEYYLYFSTILSKTTIERLADADEYEVVREVQEYFADYAPILPCLFSLNHMPSASHPLYGSSPNSWDPKALERAVQGVTAVLLSLKKKPVIRYERSSPMAKKLGVEIQHRMQSESSLFDFRLTQVPPLLLILDRRNDPVTPLLSQWTYQAMVHELLGIQNGRVDLSLLPDIRPELKEVTLTPSTDPFFQAHHLATFGDLGTSLKAYVQSYQSHSLAHNPQSINSITDMKRFVEEYPEFRKLGGNVSKHVALVGELSRLVDRDKLLDIGEVEQGLATGSGADLRLVYVILNIAGSDQRQDDLFSAESLFAKGRSALKGLKGVENVYMQHQPHLAETLENLFRGRLRDTSHPFLDGAGPNASLQRPQDVIIFMIGGTTYAEARVVALLNQESTQGGASSAGTRLLLGGTCVHNSSSFVDMIRSAAVNFSASVYEPPPGSSSTMPALNLNLGGVNVSLGGPAGTGVYRTSGEGVSLQADGIKDGVKNLFGKTTEDVKVKTRTGAFLTILSAAIILAFTTIEFLDYRRVNIDTSILVDKSRGEKLNVRMNITFPRVPCYLLSLDVMDISGETQTDISHNIVKTRLSQKGESLQALNANNELRNDLDKLNEQRGEKYCGSCFGGKPSESGCCNTCEQVRQAYLDRGWSFNRPDSIEQCVSEGWSDKLKEQADEGCNIAGKVRVNKVVGNIHLSPGRSFRSAAQNIYDLVPYLRDDKNRHDFSHVIHEFGFESDQERDRQRQREFKGMLGIEGNPLDKTTKRTSKQQYMFQYFLKVVSTQFNMQDSRVYKMHQYSVTHFERDLSKGQQEDNKEGTHVAHTSTGIPGAFFNYDISPILIVHDATRQSFAHFLTSTCAIVGGVLTVASLIDSMLFSATRALKQHGSGAHQGYSNGKLM